MLQQNNNNNYPCLSMSGTTREMLQKCSRAALPFPSRLELGDLPLIRGLRAWALCSKNRRKAGGLLGSGQSPTARPAGHRNSTSCTKPADVYLSGEWSQMGYGLPLGLDARQAEIGALVTVATLKTSEGGGKTQTQCLFLRTEKGSCLYSTAKPGSGVATSAASSVVGGWLKGKTGGGGIRDITGGRRDGGSTLSLQTGANRVRMRSGRRWRKSSNVVAREKPIASREWQQRSREDPAGEIALGERKEVQDKGALDSKLFHSLQQDGKRAQQDKEGACRAPKCSHNASTKACPRCERGAQRREEQKEHVGDESPSNEMKDTRKEKPKVDEEEKEEDKSSLCELGLSNVGLSIQNSDQESNSFHPQSHSCRNAEETREAESNEEQDSHGKDEKGKGNLCEEVRVNGLSDRLEANRDSEKESVTQTPTVPSAMSNRYQDISVSSWSESSANVEGTSCLVQRKLGNTHQEQHQTEEDPGIMGKEELRISSFEARELNFVPNENNTVKSNKNRKVFCDDCQTSESAWRDELVSKERINPEGADEAGEQELDDNKADNKKETHTEDVVSACAKLENHCEIKRNCSPENVWRSDGCKKPEEENEDSCGQTSITQAEARGESSTDVTNVACTDPSSSPGLCRANEAPRLPPLGSMATGLPLLVAEEEVEKVEDGVRVTARDGEGGQTGKRRIGSELEEQGEGETEEEEEKVEEDEFGVFMQAEGEPACSGRVTMSASVPCGSRACVALGNHTITGEPTCWTDSSFQQSEDSWTAFPQDSADGGGDAVGQWWPSSAVEERRLSAGPSLVSVFAEAFPSLPGSSPSDPCDLNTVPTLTQLLRGRASQDHWLLDSFHDLNKMIGQRYKRDAGVSRHLLLKTLHLEQPQTESRPAPWTANRRLSPGLPSANQHAQNAAAKRRLSYDYNRNITD
ncbi:hypothetical protein Q8A73_007140 [Channa argus]|nr:hypothetical protein Q8A73_007140 [Channa argus]